MGGSLRQICQHSGIVVFDAQSKRRASLAQSTPDICHFAEIYRSQVLCETAPPMKSDIYSTYLLLHACLIDRGIIAVANGTSRIVPGGIDKSPIITYLINRRDLVDWLPCSVVCLPSQAQNNSEIVLCRLLRHVLPIQLYCLYLLLGVILFVVQLHANRVD